MSNVTLSIGGRNFTIACADGEEEHVASLGRLVDEKAQEAGMIGQSETRMLLFASLLLADEVHDLKRLVHLATGNGGPEALAARLGNLAGRIENLADLLESSAANA